MPNKGNSLFDTFTDDSAVVEVPVGQLRTALWYFDNYQLLERKEAQLREIYDQAVMDNLLLLEQVKAIQEQQKFNMVKDIFLWSGVGVAVAEAVIIGVLLKNEK